MNINNEKKYLRNENSHFQTNQSLRQTMDSDLQNINQVKDGKYVHIKVEAAQENFSEQRHFDLQNDKSSAENIPQTYCTPNTDTNCPGSDNPLTNLDTGLWNIKQEVEVDKNNLRNLKSSVEKKENIYIYENTDLNGQDEDNSDAGKLVEIINVKHEVKELDEQTIEPHVEDKTSWQNVKYLPNDSDLTNETSEVFIQTDNSYLEFGKFETSNTDAEKKTDRPHQCNVCGKGFDVAFLLRRHLVSHSSEQPHQCNLCKKRFKRASDLKKHIKRIHSNGQRHQCDVCHKTFKAAVVLQRHMLGHSSERPHQCNMCNKGFKRAFGLKTHMISHSLEWPHQCNLCGKEFKTLANLRKHMTRHSTEQAHRCNVCDNGFRRAFDLEMHMISHNSK